VHQSEYVPVCSPSLVCLILVLMAWFIAATSDSVATTDVAKWLRRTDSEVGKNLASFGN